MKLCDSGVHGCGISLVGNCGLQCRYCVFKVCFCGFKRRNLVFKGCNSVFCGGDLAVCRVHSRLKLGNSGLQRGNICSLRAGQRFQCFNCVLCLDLPSFERGNVRFEGVDITFIGVDLIVRGGKTCFQSGHSVLQRGDCSVHCSISRFEGGFQCRILRVGISLCICDCLIEFAHFLDQFFYADLMIERCFYIVYCGFKIINCILQCLFVALIVEELCVDGDTFSNRSSGIKRCLIRIIREPAHEEAAVDGGGFKGNRVALCNPDLFIVNSVNTVVYGNGADRQDLDVTVFVSFTCLGIRRCRACRIITRRYDNRTVKHGGKFLTEFIISASGNIDCIFFASGSDLHGAVANVHLVRLQKKHTDMRAG